ncbi:helix-turn-helix transcriptional regulator [Saccharomonospora sp. CUA-673]|uniref:response regulator transcription factor n=1 Tax=Saccharomonospora sp. CUA-673 TaxID=1904969 RepID=UPI0009618057|nr:response regulator transcription factor [Saccharomonospora sp. CUA-673]OLT38736.1 helix-turn-helix transcriptional regulator [Saccharomonospora sp. CUA-673]
MAHGIERGRPTGSPGPAGTRTLTVAALDPVPVFREGLNVLISKTPGLQWAGHAASHHASLQLCEQLRPNIVILDSGFDPHCHLVRLLRDGDPTLVVVVLVRDAHRTPQFLSTAATAGAHATVPRTAEPRRLAEAIRRAHIDRRYTDPALAALTARPKRQSSAEGTDPGQRQQMPLSRREYQVLQLVAEGLENSAIAKTLFLSVETVRTHVKSILRKLSARDRTHAVTKAFRSGILIPRPEESTAPSADGAVTAPPPQHTPPAAPPAAAAVRPTTPGAGGVTA